MGRFKIVTGEVNESLPTISKALKKRDAKRLYYSDTYWGGINRIAVYYPSAFRNVNKWKPATRNLGTQFRTLAEHLFAEYPIPPAMTSLWISARRFNQAKELDWYLKVGRGVSLRELKKFPVTFTKLEAHYFRLAPQTSSLEKGILWSQIQAISQECDPKASKLLFDALCKFEEAGVDMLDPFWKGVIQFFIQKGFSSRARLMKMLHFLLFIKEGIVLRGKHLIEETPEDPDFSLKGRTVASLERLADSYQEVLDLFRLKKNTDWRPVSIRDYQSDSCYDAAQTIPMYTITQLLSAKELIEEGRNMNHCVGSYSTECQSGTSSIWSLRKWNGRHYKSIATLQVQNALGQVIEAKANANASLSYEARILVWKWMAREQLTPNWSDY